MFITADFSKDSLLRLNRVRVHQQVLFLSCILGASGKILDKKYLHNQAEIGEIMVYADVPEGKAF